MFEVHERLVGPYFAPQILPRDHRSRVPQEERQNAKGLVGQGAPVAISNQLAGPQIQRAVAEPENLRARRCERHGHLLFNSEEPIRPVRACHVTSVSSSNRPQIIERTTAPVHGSHPIRTASGEPGGIMKTVYDVVGTRVGERTGGETWRSSHRSGVKKLPRSWSILIVSIVGGAVLAGNEVAVKTTPHNG